MFTRRLIPLMVLAALMASPLSANLEQQSTPFRLALKGFLKAPETMEKCPPFEVSFLGKSTQSDDEGYFTLILDDVDDVDALDVTEYYLFVGKTHLAFERRNTPVGELAAEGKHYLMFKMSKNIDDVWEVNRAELPAGSRTLPQNVLVITLNPAYVDRVEPWDFPLAENYISGPRIVLRDSIMTGLSREDRKKGRGTVDRASRKSILYGLDERAFQERVRPTRDPKHRNISIPG